MRYFLLSGVLALSAACSSEQGVAEVQASAEAPATTPNSDTPQAPQALATPEATAMTKTTSGLYSLQADTLEDDGVDLATFAGKVTLIVNVASECGYTRQYAGLQQLHAELEDQGFAVLGFPSNEFGGQEPGGPQEIRQFCTERFDVSFPMFAKSEVKSGSGQSPVYSFLEAQTGEVPGWNFCKYLVGPDGQVIAFYKSGVEPDSAELRKAIEAALG